MDVQIHRPSYQLSMDILINQLLHVYQRITIPAVSKFNFLFNLIASAFKLIQADAVFAI